MMIEALNLTCLAIAKEEDNDSYYMHSDAHFLHTAFAKCPVCKFYNDIHSEAISVETCRRRLHKLEKEGLVISKPRAGACTNWVLVGFIEGK